MFTHQLGDIRRLDSISRAPSSPANEVPPTDRRHLGVRAEVHEVSGAPNDLAWRSMKGGCCRPME